MAIDTSDFIAQLVQGAQESTGSTAALSAARQRANDALGNLARLGQSEHANAILADAAGTVSYDRVTNNPDLSDTGKRKAAAAQYIAHMNTVADKLDAAAARFSQQEAADAVNTLGIGGLKGDQASLAISRRDAAGRVADETDPVKLQRLLAQATRNGDETMARAIAEQALSLGDTETLNTFTASRPQHAEAVQRMWGNASRKTTTADATSYMRLNSLKPQILGKLHDGQIEAAAQAE